MRARSGPEAAESRTPARGRPRSWTRTPSQAPTASRPTAARPRAFAASRALAAALAPLALLGLVTVPAPLVGAVPAAAAEPSPVAAPARECAARGAEFPVRARLDATGEPRLRAGAAPRNWTVELTNTTRTRCRALHPLLVLVDAEGTLRPRQVRMEFHDGGRWRPVQREHTDRGETIGVFAGPGFEGFPLSAGDTRRVRMRLAFARDAAPDELTAEVTVVRRRGADGDWFGQSAPHRFTLLSATGRAPEATERPEPPEGRLTEESRERESRESAGHPEPGRPESGDTESGDTGAADTTGGDGLPDSWPRPELARTGQRHLPQLTALAAMFLVTGTVLLRVARKLARNASRDAA
ncbi:hypothetical protein ACH4TU_10430 [Streptomyces physcomitrii]|uniref:hypothetical protein n=1 Tax=Streptomyces physcomitrii TaxID=2724184 RepID=UPI001331746A